MRQSNGSLSVVLVVLWLGGTSLCGCAFGIGNNPRASGGDPLPLPAASSPGALLAAPDVAPGVLALLQRELQRQLDAAGTLRTASQVATTAENRVTTLAQERSGGQVTLTWVERAVGDYSQDGQVSAADLVPVGQYWQATSAAPNWADAARADGNGDGAVNLGDVAPIGRNFGNQLVAYSVYTGATAVFGDCNWIASAGHNTATLVGSERHYSVTLNAADAGLCFFVAPTDGTLDGIESTPSHLWGTPNWAHMAHFTSGDNAVDIAWDEARQVFYVAGGTFNTTDTSYDFVLAKYSANGNLLWARAWGTTAYDFCNALAVAPDGSIYLVGDSTGVGAGAGDALVVKWDPDGNVLWARGWGSTGASPAVANDVAVNQDGTVFVGAVLGDLVTTSVMVLLAYTPSGGVSTATTWGSGAHDGGVSLTVDASNIYFLGNTDRGLEAGQLDPVVVCYDFGAMRQWGKIYHTASESIAYEIACNATNLFIGGSTGYDGSGLADNLTLGLDHSGNVLWNSISGGGGQTDIIYSVVADAAGNSFFAGLSTSFSPGMHTALLQKYDASGALQWTQLWQGISPVEFRGMCFDGAGMLALCGQTNSLNRGWVAVGLPSATLTFAPADIVSPDVPLSGNVTDATGLGVLEVLGQEIDLETALPDTNFAIASFKQF